MSSKKIPRTLKRYSGSKKLPVFTFFAILLTAVSAIIASIIISDRDFSTLLKSRASTVKLVAFPGAEGFGANALGGRRGRIFEVINLNDSGAGSLRECINSSGARICIFKVGGTIKLNSALIVNNPYLTIAGQTAPGGGITITNSVHVDPLISIHSHDVIIRFLTLRPKVTRETPDEFDALNISTDNGRVQVYNIVVDHCSMSWGTDQIFASWYGPHDISVQWSIFAEGLSYSTHSKGRHSKGPMLGSYADNEAKTGIGAYNVSFHHNLMANNEERNPLMKGGGIMDVVNNVGFNPFESANQGSFGYIDIQANNAIMKQNWVGNFYKSPPGEPLKPGLKTQYITGAQGLQVYVSKNIGPASSFVDSGSQQYIYPTRFTAPEVTTYSCNSAVDCEVYNKVLAGSGNYQGINANGGWFSRRDAVDKRVIEGVKGTNGYWGKIIDAPGATTCKGICRGGSYVLTLSDYTKYGINDPLDVNGWPIISGGTAYPDTDHDGVSDNWEVAIFGGLTTVTNLTDYESDGYTDLEEFLNGTDPKVSDTGTVIQTPTPSVSPTKIPTSVPTRTPTPRPTNIPSPFPTAIKTPIPTPTTGSNMMNVSSLYYDPSTTNVTVHLVVVNPATNTKVYNAFLSYSLTNITTGQIWYETGNTDLQGVENYTISSAPKGCYVTSISRVSKSGWVWNGITPANKFCL